MKILYLHQPKHNKIPFLVKKYLLTFSKCNFLNKFKVTRVLCATLGYFPSFPRKRCGQFSIFKEKLENPQIRSYFDDLCSDFFHEYLLFDAPRSQTESDTQWTVFHESLITMLRKIFGVKTVRKTRNFLSSKYCEKQWTK